MAKKVKYAIGFLNKQLKHQSVMLWVHIFYNIFQKLESNDMFRIQKTNKTIITLNAYVVHQRRFFSGTRNPYTFLYVGMLFVSEI